MSTARSWARCAVWCLVWSTCTSALADQRTVSVGAASEFGQQLASRGWSARMLATPVETPARRPFEPGPRLLADSAVLDGEDVTLAEVLYWGASHGRIVPVSSRYDAEYDFLYLELLAPTRGPVGVVLKDEAGMLRVQRLDSRSGGEVGWGAADAFWELLGTPGLQ